jgi:hypothetical protein
LNQKFVSSIIDGTTQEMINVLASIDPNDPTSVQAAQEKSQQLGQVMKEKVQKAALDEGLNTSIGGHILVGLRAKLPIIPIAAYGNFKYYIGGDYPSEVDPGNMTVELGVGLAI